MHADRVECASSKEEILAPNINPFIFQVRSEGMSGSSWRTNEQCQRKNHPGQHISKYR